MTTRNLSPQQMFNRLAGDHVPLCRFSGTDRKSFTAWKQKTLPKVLTTIGDPPPEAPLRPELLAEWEQDGLLRQRWIIDVQQHLSATVLVNIPGGLGRKEKRPAILCCHGHGPFGKESVMGNDSSPELRANIALHRYDYGRVMAQQGFVTYAIDWIGFGERNDNNKPNHRALGDGRDWCNLYYPHATMFGMTSLSINVAHGRAATEIICYSDRWAAFGIRDLNYCGMQVAPGLYRLVDLPDLQGLIAPRPLLISIGVQDTCFRVDTALQCHERLSAVYRAAGAGENLELDLHPGEHGWGGNRSEAFFTKHLQLSPPRPSASA